MKIAYFFKFLSKFILKKDVCEFKKKLTTVNQAIKKRDMQINSKTIKMLILAEDHRFFSHGGVDFLAILRAIYKTIFHFQIEGGSTIEQQLVRVVTGRYQRTISRKITEIIFASVVSDVIEKNEIPQVYLCLAYYGYNMNGYHQCARKLSKDPSKLSEQESANLIARLKYPEPRDNNPRKSHLISNRVRYILHKYNGAMISRNDLKFVVKPEDVK